VRVWFGNHVIADYSAEPELARRYTQAMARRFAGLRVTDEPMDADLMGRKPLPRERLWEIGPN
jgi:hypothetical protein